MKAETEVRDVVRAVLRNPHWTLAELSEQIAAKGTRATALGRVTIADLMANIISDAPSVIELLGEAEAPIAAAEIRERLGTPRWKLAECLRQLHQHGLVERLGTTCGARYQLAKLGD